MRKNVFLILTLMLMTAIAAIAQTQDPAKPAQKESAKDASIAGAWNIVITTEQGERPPGEITFTQEKEAIKVTMSGPQGASLKAEGTLKDGVIQWTAVVSTSQGDFPLTFKGKVEGEKMSGDVQMGDFGTATWSATKVKK